MCVYHDNTYVTLRNVQPIPLVFHYMPPYKMMAAGPCTYELAI